MMQFGLIGLGAGAAAALLFASVTSGSWLSVILFYLAPLPIMIAGIGWSHWAALVAALTGALALGLVFGLVYIVAFLAGAGVPAWWLGYLAMLARPAAAGANGGSPAPLEWYPPGRLVVWAAALGALVVILAIPNFGIDADGFRAGLRQALNSMLRMQPDLVPGNNERFLDFMVAAIPPAAAVLAAITNIFNLWLAGRVVKFSGLLKRPWPQLSAMRFPPLTVAVLLVAVGLSFVGGMIGIVAAVLSASLLLAFAVLGFAVLHAITDGTKSRPFALGTAYAATLVLGWPVVALSVLGAIEAAVNLRDRILRWRGRPPLPS